MRYIINTPYHARWYLPDGEHMLNIVLYGSSYQMSVLGKDGRTKESLHISVDKKTLYNGFIAAAERKYRKRSAFEHRNTSIRM